MTHLIAMAVILGLTPSTFSYDFVLLGSIQWEHRERNHFGESIRVLHLAELLDERLHARFPKAFAAERIR